MDSFYQRDGDLFVSSEVTRGPWNRDHQHGGPPAALATRAIEAVLPEGARVVKMTIELPRPVPIAPLAVTAELVRAGRRVAHATAQLAAGGVVVLRAAATAVRALPLDLPPAPPEAPPRQPGDSAPFEFPFFRWSPGYHEAMELRLARGVFGEGRLALWFRMRGALVDGEAPSPLCRVMCAADSASGTSLLLDTRRWSFLNPELTVHLVRPPGGEWVCLDAETRVAPGGVGLAESRLWDEAGPIGRSAQALVVDTVDV